MTRPKIIIIKNKIKFNPPNMQLRRFVAIFFYFFKKKKEEKKYYWMYLPVKQTTQHLNVNCFTRRYTFVWTDFSYDAIHVQRAIIHQNTNCMLYSLFYSTLCVNVFFLFLFFHFLFCSFCFLSFFLFHNIIFFLFHPHSFQFLNVYIWGPIILSILYDCIC